MQPTISGSAGLKQFADALGALGYSAGVVPRRLAGAVAIDREVCADGACDDCGHAGLSLVPFTRPAGGYVAVAVCPACAAATEF